MTQLRTLLTTLILFAFPATAWADHRVTLEVITEKGLSITALQEWTRLLNDKGADSVKLRTGRDGEKVGIEEVNLGRSQSYRVTAILGRDQTLHMPDGKRFTKRNLGELPQWFQRIKVGGEDELMRQPESDGMTRAERNEVLAKLSKPLDFSTKDQPLAETLGAVRELTGLNFSASPAMIAQVKLLKAKDELNGYCAGTAMAILLRAHGLIVVPKREIGGTVNLHVLPMAASDDGWPVSQPLKQSPADTCPVLFQFIEVEINRTPLEKALGAIGPRLNTPIFFDHYKIAQDNIDTNVDVRFPKDKTFYKKILDHILYQAFLGIDLKVDEAGKPFLWITSAKRG
ncbi:hypothetical protein Pan97_03530 [Bremerella volcania]|uniref:Uncharacterized protein n=1 Tax=Bremerella volcania TaxID=2527984 RepID=A0A518C2E0_9BACT|nr:hypothetical protein [Bremerella volcania]QDU73383.1 hypothetical protein Pan97_03530 [Bremerella volcania]